MDSIEQHIEKDKEILEDPTLSPQMRRHTVDELQHLEKYHEAHPEDHHDPTRVDENPKQRNVKSTKVNYKEDVTVLFFC